jgi:hypothetical protein
MFNVANNAGVPVNQVQIKLDYDNTGEVIMSMSVVGNDAGGKFYGLGFDTDLSLSKSQISSSQNWALNSPSNHDFDGWGIFTWGLASKGGGASNAVTTETVTISGLTANLTGSAAHDYLSHFEVLQDGQNGTTVGGNGAAYFATHYFDSANTTGYSAVTAPTTPELSTWLMCLTGTGLIGLSRLRRAWGRK